MEFLKRDPLLGNTILIKGSRGIRLEKIYDLL
jgi:UDP-N-acetylmuramyl pentapeptide synthase